MHRSGGNCTGTAAISTTGDLGEADLDIEWAGGIAKNATVDFVYAPYSDVTDNTLGSLRRVAVCGAELQGSGHERSFAGDQHELYRLRGEFCGRFELCELGDQHWAAGEFARTDDCGCLGRFGSGWLRLQGHHGLSGDSMEFRSRVPADSPNYTGVGGTTLSGDESDSCHVLESDAILRQPHGRVSAELYSRDGVERHRMRQITDCRRAAAG